LPSLRRYLLVRLIFKLLMAIIILTFLFFLFCFFPDEPLGGPEQKKPLLYQYVGYFVALLSGDWGRSALTQRPVLDEILEGFPATLELSISSLLVAFTLGLTLGVWSARKGWKGFDLLSEVDVLPVFWLGMLLQMALGVKAGILPVSGRVSPLMEPQHITGLYLIDSILTLSLASLWDAFRYIFLPSLTLGIGLSGVFYKLIKGGLLKTLKMDFIKALKARGIPEDRIFYRHALKSALLSVLAKHNLIFALLFSGVILIEVTFSWPGVGNLLVKRIVCKDFLAVQGILVFYTVLILIFGFTFDLIRVVIDPRVRCGEEGHLLELGSFPLTLRGLVKRKVSTFVAMAILLVFLVLFALAPLIAPYDPIASVGPLLSPPTRGFIMGTDHLGRDLFSRVVWGGRTALTVAFLSALLSTSVGLALALISGLVGGVLGRIITTIMDSLYYLPALVLAIALALALGAGIGGVSLSIAIVHTPVYFRVTKERLEALGTLGASDWMTLRLYILKEVFPYLLAKLPSSLADAILIKTALSFSGVGVSPLIADWGADLYNAHGFILQDKWWMVLYPGLMVALLTLGFKLLGEREG